MKATWRIVRTPYKWKDWRQKGLFCVCEHSTDMPSVVLHSHNMPRAVLSRGGDRDHVVEIGLPVHIERIDAFVTSLAEHDEVVVHRHASLGTWNHMVNIELDVERVVR